VFSASFQAQDLLPADADELEDESDGRPIILVVEDHHDQPIAAGHFCTGFLVKPDVTATAAHFAHEGNAGNLRFVFGYHMSDGDTPVTQVPKDNVYAGTGILKRVYDRQSGSDWALVKLDRPVRHWNTAVLSRRDIRKGEPVYVLGHPCGLPLKYVPGAPVTQIHADYFSAELTIYGGNSGSPVFNSAHELVGMVVRGDVQNPPHVVR